MNIKVKQRSDRVSSNRWSWAVWLEGPETELDRIKSVVYQLHETFPNPVRMITDRASKFILKSAGWGEFMIYINVEYRDGAVKKLYHWLQLGSEAGSKEVERPGPKLKGEVLTVFVSSGLADSELARRIKDALSRQGMKVLSSDEVAVGSEVQASLSKMLEQADLGVAVISAQTSAYVEAEVEEMQRANTPVIPLLRRESEGEYPIPPSVRELKGVPVDESSDPDGLAREIMNLAPRLRGEG